MRRAAEDLWTQLKPVAAALDILQAADCTLAIATDVWRDLLEKFPKQFKAAHKKAVERSALVMEDPAYLAAHPGPYGLS